MTLSDLQQDLNSSLKAHQTDRVETLRFLIAAVRNAAIAKYGNEADTKLTEADILDVVKKQVKTHRESIEAFISAGRQELADREKAQLAVLEEFVPKEISDEELKKLLEAVSTSIGRDPSASPSTLSSGPKGSGQAFGLVMKSAMVAVGGKADGGRVAAMLKQMLQ